MPQHKSGKRPLLADLDTHPQEAPATGARPDVAEPTDMAGVAGVAVRRRAGSDDPLGGSPISADLSSTLKRRSGGGRPLPDDVASSFGQAYGADLSGVRVHDDGEADTIARSVESVAFTHGQDVYFTQGTYRPGGGGDHTLAHELAHVAQQRTGRDAAPGAAGTIGRAHDPVEADADRMAGDALGGLRRMAAGAQATTTAPAATATATAGAVRRLRDSDEEKEWETEESLEIAGAMFDDEEKRQERATKQGGGLSDDSVDGIGTMFGDEEKRGQRRRKKGGGGLTDDSVGGVEKLIGDEEKRTERATKQGGGLTDDSVDGIGTMFGDEEKRGQRRRKKGGGGITDDSVSGVDKMIGDEQKIADKKDQRRARKGKGGLTLGSAADVAEFFDLQDRDWLTPTMEPNPDTPKVHLLSGTKVIEVVNGTEVEHTTNKPINVDPKVANPKPWMWFSLGGKTYYVKADQLKEDPALKHVRDDAPVFALDKKGDPIPPTPDDVKQYGLGDCYLEAALASLAATSPGQIMDMVKDYGNTATVRLFDVKRDKVKKDQTDPGEYNPNTPATFKQKLIRVEKSRVRKGGDLQYDAGALWVGIIEKAYTAGKFGGSEDMTDEARQPGQTANYGSIEGGLARYAWEVLLGRPSVLFDITQGAEQTASDRKDMPWSTAEVAEYHKSAKKFFGSSYSGLVSYQVFDQSKKKVDSWMKWLKGKGQAAITKLFTDVAGEKAGGYEHGTIRLEDFELVFSDNGLPTDLAVPMLTYLEAYFPGKRGSGKYTRDQLRLWHQIQKALNEGVLIGLDSHVKVGRASSGSGASGGEAMTKGLAGGHAYSLLGTAVVGDLKFVKIRNPWGKYSRDYDMSEKDGTTKLGPKAVAEGNGQSMLELTDLTKRFRMINFS